MNLITEALLIGMLKLAALAFACVVAVGGILWLVRVRIPKTGLRYEAPLPPLTIDFLDAREEEDRAA